MEYLILEMGLMRYLRLVGVAALHHLSEVSTFGNHQLDEVRKAKVVILAILQHQQIHSAWSQANKLIELLTRHITYHK